MTIENDKFNINCFEVCRTLSSNFYEDNYDIKKHIQTCDSCEKFYQQQKQLLMELEQAIKIPVPEGLASRILLQHSIRDKTKVAVRWSRFIFLETAMSVPQLAVTHIKSEPYHLLEKNDVQLNNCSESLSTWQYNCGRNSNNTGAPFFKTRCQYVHVSSTATSMLLMVLKNGAPVLFLCSRWSGIRNSYLAELNGLLKTFNMKLDSSLGQVNYAGSCPLRDSTAVHLVVQTLSGPVSILLMPNEVVNNR